MNEEDRKLDSVFRSYAMDYFKIHADQRLRAFNFFLILQTALIAVFATLAKDGNCPIWAAVIGVLGAVISFVFWKLDERTRFLVKIAEASLKCLDARWHLGEDADGAPSALTLFAREEFLAQRQAIDMHAPVKMSYSRSFNLMFAAFAAIHLSISVAIIVSAS